MSGKDLAEQTAKNIQMVNAAFAEDAGAGFEEADRDSYAIPFLKLLQDLSPEVDKKQGSAIPGAISGMFYDSATGALFEGVPGLLLLPVHFIRRFLRWEPRSEGGGFRGSMTPAEVLEAETHEDPALKPAGALWLPDGSFLSDTREHYCLYAAIPKEGEELGEIGRAVVSLASTQIKWSKKWMSAMQARRIAGADGRSFCPPMYSMWWQAQAMVQSNNEGSWYGWRITPAAALGSHMILDMAKQFREAIISGEAKAEQPTEANAPHGDIPF